MTTEIDRNIAEIRGRIGRACQRTGRFPSEVTLVAITKNIDPSLMRLAFHAGVRHFGESRIQEAKTKLAQLQDIKDLCTWHMIGHLQTNKAKTAIELFDIIQSVDSLGLAGFLSRHSSRALPILIEVNVAGEQTKGGFSLEEVEAAIDSIGKLPNLKIEGLMTVAPWSNDAQEARPMFRQLRELRTRFGLKELSMGMTDDFEVAVEEGSTMVRIGRGIFGERRVAV